MLKNSTNIDIIKTKRKNMKYKILELRPYMIDENDELYQMLQEIPAVDEFDQHNEYHGMNKEQVKARIAKMMQHAYNLNVNQDYPQCENFVFYVNNKPVCIGGLMIQMDDFWRRHRGHIWYKTRPSERKKGYCTMFVKLLCERAKDLGFKEITSQCDINNYGSNKVLLNNGFTTYTNPLCPDWDDTNFYRKEL